MREQTVLHQPPHVILGCQSTFIKARQGVMAPTLGSDAGVLNLSEYHIQTLMINRNPYDREWPRAGLWLTGHSSATGPARRTLEEALLWM